FYITSFFLIAPSPTEIYTLSLHDALPILLGGFQEVEDNLAALRILEDEATAQAAAVKAAEQALSLITDQYKAGTVIRLSACSARSEEHTSELQSRFDLVCRLLLEKKNHNK